MFIKLNYLTKKFCLFIGFEIVIISFFVFKVEGKNLIGEIVELAKEERELNKKIIKKMHFELSEKQISLSGDNEKYLLKDLRGNLWIFKPDSEDEVKNAKIVSDIAQLLGVNVPVLDKIIFPINGKEVLGAIQKIGFNDILRLENISVMDLSPENILSLQKLQVLDWLLIAPRSEMEEACFIVSKKNNEIWGIDKDDCFENVKDGRILEMTSVDWKDTLYSLLWDSYIKGEININFSEVFQLINYIQHINDAEFKKIWIFLNADEKKQFLEEVIWRKNNLRKEFEKFYRVVIKKRGELFHIPLKNDYDNYAERFLKKKKEQISSKKLECEWLISKDRGIQKNIEVISAREMWWLISLWLKKYCKKSITLQEIIEKSQKIKENSFFIGERLVIELYIRQLKTKKKQNICRIIKHPKMLNPIEMEYNLRMDNYDIFINNNCGEISTFKERGNILAHLRYIDIMKAEKKDKELISEYKQKLEINPDEMTYLFLSVISEAEYSFNPVVAKVTMNNTDILKSSLATIDDHFSWKYYGFALCDYEEGDIQRGIKNCEKIIKLNNNKEAIYAAYMLLGFFYEHNENIRFGGGFNIKKAIFNYRKALKINPKSLEARLNLANLYLIRKMPKKALREFRKIKGTTSQYAGVYFHLSNIKKKNVYKNKEEYLEAVKMNTLSSEDHYVLGLAYAARKDYEKAGRHFDKAREFGYNFDMELN